MRSNQWLVIISFLGVSACARAVAPSAPSEGPAAAIWVLKSDVSYEGEARRFRANMQIRMQEDSLLWASFSPGFGLEALRVRMDAKEVVALDRFHKTYSVYSYAVLGRRYGVPLSYTLCEALLMGRLPSDTLVYQRREEDTLQVFTHPTADLRLYASNRQLTKVEAQDTEAQDTKGRRLVLTYTHKPVLTIEARLYVHCPEPCTLRDVLHIRHKEIRRQEEIDFPFEIPAQYIRR